MIKKYKEQPEKNKNTKIQGEGVFQMSKSSKKTGQLYLQPLRWKENFNQMEFVHYFQ